MEFWEGAVLVVGGVLLVRYMASKAQPAALPNAATMAPGPTGASNSSNLTTITNQAGGTPTVAGEPLTPDNPPVLPPAPPIAQPMPVKGTIFYPGNGPVEVGPPISAPVACKTCSSPVHAPIAPTRYSPTPIIARPIDRLQML